MTFGEYACCIKIKRFGIFHFKEQHSGGGRLRAGSTHGGRQERGKADAGKAVWHQEARPPEEIHGGGKPLLDGSRDDPWYELQEVIHVLAYLC